MHEINFANKKDDSKYTKTIPTVEGDVDLKQIDKNTIVIDSSERRDFPIVEHTNNAIIWPEEIKGGIDLTNTYEVTSVPENPDTPLESVETLEDKGAMPK